MERIVMMENREMESIPSFLSMSFLLRTLRLWKVRLEPLYGEKRGEKCGGYGGFQGEGVRGSSLTISPSAKLKGKQQLMSN